MKIISLIFCFFCIFLIPSTSYSNSIIPEICPEQSLCSEIQNEAKIKIVNETEDKSFELRLDSLNAQFFEAEIRTAFGFFCSTIYRKMCPFLPIFTSASVQNGCEVIEDSNNQGFLLIKVHPISAILDLQFCLALR